MIQLHHAISLALIYTYRATYGSVNMVTTKEVKKYQEVVNNNLKDMHSKVSHLTPSDYEVNLDELFFTYAKDINEEEYYILKDDHESVNKRQKYIMNMPLDIVLASQKNNALKTINLFMIDGKIIKKEPTKVRKLAK